MRMTRISRAPIWVRGHNRFVRCDNRERVRADQKSYLSKLSPTRSLIKTTGSVDLSQLQEIIDVHLKCPEIYDSPSYPSIPVISTVVTQYYDTDVNKEYVIRGNPAVLKCQIPSFVADFVEVISWHTDQDETFDASETKFG